LKDELGLTWLVLEGDALYDRLRRVKLENEECACWRDHFFVGLEPWLADEARKRLEALTEKALASPKPDDPLLESVLHASRAFTLLDDLDQSS